MQVRAAATEEVIDLRWRVLRPGRPRDSAAMPGDDDPLTRHWIALRNEITVGVVTVMAQPWPSEPDLAGGSPRWRLRGMAVAPELHRSGVGRALLHVVHREVAAPMWCDARLVAVPFYAAAGWKVASEAFDIAGIGPHHKMVWEGA